MNLSNLKPDLLEYIDSPVPYLIGISDKLLSPVRTKFLSQDGSAPTPLILRLDGGGPCRIEGDLVRGPEKAGAMLCKTLKEIGQQVGKGAMGEVEGRMQVKQAVMNYMVVVLGDVRGFIEGVRFNHERYIEERGKEGRKEFYEGIVQT